LTIAGKTDVGVDLWGGYCPSMPAAQLPQGASPNCQDVVFPMGAVRSRPRLFSFFPALAGNPTINGAKVYAALAQNILLLFDSLGNLWAETVPGSLTLVQGGLVPGTFMNGVNLFGRFYFGLFDKFGGKDIPRQYDGTNLDRVSQIGPAVAPAAVDENVVWNLAGGTSGAIAGNTGIGTVSETGFVVTLVTGLLSGFWPYLRVGDPIQITGVGVSGYNGTFAIASLSSDGKTLTYVNTVSGLANSSGGTINLPIVIYTPASSATPVAYADGQLITVAGVGVVGYNVANQKVRASSVPGILGYGGYPIGSGDIFAFLGAGAFGLAASGGGTVTNAGNIVVGLHGVTVAYITRQGFITCPAPPIFWSATGNKRAVIGPIPKGPANVIQRLLLFTQVITPPATTGTFFSLPGTSMLVQDNTTTFVTVDFLDGTLAAGFNGQYLFSQIELGECAAVNDYNSRLIWIRERNKVKADGGGGGFTNLTFDASDTSPAFPPGWTPDSNAALNGGSSLTSTAYWAVAYQIQGDGASAVRGRISQTAAQDYLGNQILQLNTSYSARVRMRSAGNAATQGTFNIEIFSPSAGSLGIFSVAATALTGNFVEFSGALLAPQTAIPSDTLLRIDARGTLTNGSIVIADCIELFPTKTPFNLNLARTSHANNPESYDGLLDQIQIQALGDIGPAGVQGIQAAWKIRSNLYLAKDHYLCYVTDDGANEPSVWQVQEVSNTIGCCGPNAWDGTEEWVCMAERSGMYYTTGSDPMKVCQEIQEDVSQSGKPNWNATNWTAGFTVWLLVDHLSKRILCGLPLNGAATPNLVFHMDYKFAPTGEAMASSQAPTYSTFTGRILVHGNARKWSPWNMTINSAVFSERPDGTAQLFMGNGAGNGKVYEAVDASAQGSDDGTPVNDFYQTYGNPSKFEEEGLQLGHHMKHVGYVTGRVTGSGFLSVQAISPYRTQQIRAIALSTNPIGDFERKVSINGERVFWQVGTNAANNWFQLERLIPSVKRHATIPVRGLSA